MILKRKGYAETYNDEFDTLSFDKFDGQDGELIRPDGDLVISRNVEGKALSKYGDDKWVLSPYKKKHGSSIYYDLISEKNRDEARRLMYIVLVYGRGRSGSMLSPSTAVNNYFTLAIKRLDIFATNEGISITEVLENENYMRKYIKKHLTSLSSVIGLTGFFRILDRINQKRSGINYVKDDELHKHLSRMIKKFKDAHQQTEIIPSSILSSTIRERWIQIDEIIEKEKNLAKLIRKYFKNEELFNRKNWHNSIASCGLVNIFKKYNVQGSMNIPLFFKKIQGTCKHLIIAYSGMRNAEAETLMTDCLEVVSDLKSGSITRLIGSTTKLHGYEKDVKWVTSKEMEKPIRVLLNITKAIANGNNLNQKGLPLFISTGFFQQKNRMNLFASYFTTEDQLTLSKKSLTIKEEDILQLEDIEVFRDWRGDAEFEIGKLWNIKMHQYRRSLVVYAVQSGLVSLGGLQLQMKHLLREMTLYYSNGASLSNRIFAEPKQHIAKDMREIKSELDALSYIKNVLFSDEKLYGAHGTFVENNLKDASQNKKDFLLDNREQMIEKFKNGELSYKETAIGGCLSNERCNSRLTRSIYACVSCDSGVIQESKLNNVIVKQQEFIEKYLEQDSIEYRTEMDDLKVLESFKIKIIRGKDG